MKIKLSTLSSDWPFARQTPGARGVWNGVEFLIDRDGDADWWFVFDDLPKPESIRCRHTVLITPEPPALKTYDPKFAAQFDFVITGDRALVHPRKIYSQQGLPWHVGRLQQSGQNISFSKSYCELKSLWPIPKAKLLSVIASDKRHTPGHQLRFNFVERLRAHFTDRIEVFGWGGREIPDKWDGIAPFRYHIALENSCCPDYWTEKLSDVFLAGALPIYYGCPNIFDYFDKNSLVQIDINHASKALSQIEQIITTEPCQSALFEARNRVLDRYNLFALMESFARERGNNAPLAARTLRPSATFYRPPSFAARALRKIRRS